MSIVNPILGQAIIRVALCMVAAMAWLAIDTQRAFSQAPPVLDDEAQVAQFEKVMADARARLMPVLVYVYDGT